MKEQGYKIQQVSKKKIKRKIIKQIHLHDMNDFRIHFRYPIGLRRERKIKKFEKGKKYYFLIHFSYYDQNGKNTNEEIKYEVEYFGIGSFGPGKNYYIFISKSNLPPEIKNAGSTGKIIRIENSI